ncbi:sensor histidine kinase [Cellulomonas sp. NPDC058312]|uniref:sensor histidine kinase n=1 Tax=Cellulomonas sp. NPDC058312 TaxID=3346441 RepID=UPI0036E6FA6B
MQDQRSDDPGGAPAPEFTELSARRLGPVRRFLVARPLVTDVVLIAGFTGWALLIGVGADSMWVLHAWFGGERVLQMQLASLTLTTAGALALIWRRHRPVLVAAAFAALGVAALATTGATSGFEVGAAVALYALAAARPPRVAWAACAGLVAALLSAAWLLPLSTTVGAVMLGFDPADAPRNAVWVQNTAAPVLVLALVAVAAGTQVRARRLHVAGFLEAANALARDRDQRARLAQAAERARIAREMHDIVAHSVSVMVTLAGGADAALDRAPAQSRAALRELVATGQAALDDMRRVLGVLHEVDRHGAAPLEPQPGAVELTALVERFRAAGLPVRATIPDDAAVARLGASVQLAAFRITQEALTNVLRHAPGTPGVTLTVRLGPRGVEVVVADEGPGVTAASAASPGSGRGLVGVRARAAAFGGTVSAGRSATGWTVRAHLPTTSEPT